MMSRRPAVFLDRDGTITVERGYVTRPCDLEFIPGAVGAIRRLNESGLLTVVISNQAGVARGLMTERDLASVHEALEGLLEAGGARLDAAYYCPNFEGGTVERYTRDTSCRKPDRGMIDMACRDHDIDLASSVMVGDQTVDMELAERVGIPGVLVMTGNGRRTAQEARIQNLPVAHCAPDLAAAVAWIVARRCPEGGRDETPESD
jgi:D-glycero-D-manno-heptose 1,7-bisphosphate phosphatase